MVSKLVIRGSIARHSLDLNLWKVVWNNSGFVTICNCSLIIKLLAVYMCAYDYCQPTRGVYSSECVCTHKGSTHLTISVVVINHNTGIRVSCLQSAVHALCFDNSCLATKVLLQTINLPATGRGWVVLM